MKIKRIKKLRINSRVFTIKWEKSHNGGWFDYSCSEIGIGTRDLGDLQILEIILHELYEICAEELHVRMRRTDVESDYIFVFDHRQHTTLTCMVAGLLEQFIG